MQAIKTVVIGPLQMVAALRVERAIGQHLVHLQATADVGGGEAFADPRAEVVHGGSKRVVGRIDGPHDLIE